MQSSISSTIIYIIIIIIAFVVLILLPILYSEVASKEWKEELDDNTSLNIQKNFWIYWGVIGSVFFLIFLMIIFKKWIPDVVGFIIFLFEKLSLINGEIWKKIGLIVLFIAIIIGVIYSAIYLKNNYSVIQNKAGSDNRYISDIVNCEYCSLNGGEGDEKYNANSPNQIDSLHINQDKGSTEFTWSCTIKIDDWYLTNFNSEKMVMIKGSNPTSVCEQNDSNGNCVKKYHSTSKMLNQKFKDQCPGLWLDKKENNILINFTTKIDNKTSIEGIRIYDIPLGSWFQVSIVSILNNIDIYINGKLLKSVVLEGIPVQNKGHLYTGYGGGFSGFIQKIRYINSGLGPNKILELYEYDKSYLV
jgi:hypothetical protein